MTADLFSYFLTIQDPGNAVQIAQAVRLVKRLAGL